LITLIRIKYYAGWSLCQAGVAATGLSYINEKDTVKWNRIETAMPSAELSHDI